MLPTHFGDVAGNLSLVVTPHSEMEIYGDVCPATELRYGRNEIAAREICCSGVGCALSDVDGLSSCSFYLFLGAATFLD